MNETGRNSMIIGCYDMHLYCRNQNDTWDKTHAIPGKLHTFMPYPQMVAGPSETYCRRKARRMGWVFNRDGDVTCPLCSGKLKTDEAGPRITTLPHPPEE